MALYLIPFYAVEPDLAVKETRVLTLFQSQRGIPPGSYGLIEFYCPDPTCDCRRVMLNVAEEQQPERFLASISYGFDRDAPEAGPFLDPFNEQSPYARALLELVAELVLSDAAYLARLERHYHQVKAAAEDPDHPAYQIIRQAIERELEAPEEGLNATGAGRMRPARFKPKVGRNEPCPCGSGKKYKHCCGRRR
jgi:hypothetical protein